MSKRIEWIDICKGIGIILVLIGHTDSMPCIKMIYSFHMAFFFMISGFLYSAKNVSLSLQTWLKSNLVRYILPYFKYCYINLGLYYALCLLYDLEPVRGIENLKAFLLKYIIGIFYGRGHVAYLPNCSPLWFLPALFISLTIFYSIQRLPSRNQRQAAVAACFLIGSALSYSTFPKPPMSADTAVMASFFIAVGYVFRKRYMTAISLFESKPMAPKCSVFLILGLLGYIADHHNVDVLFVNNDYGNVVLMLVSSLSLSACTLMIALFIEYNKKKYGINKLCQILSWYGRNTVFIFAFDYFAMKVCKLTFKIGSGFPLFIGKTFLISIALLIIQSAKLVVKTNEA